MTNAAVRTDNRTIYEATLDVRFGCHYNDMNARLYRRLDLCFGFVGLFGGSSAFIAALGQYRTLGVVAGATIAALAVVERLVRPVEKAIEHEECRRRFSDLDQRIDALDLPVLERELKRLQGSGPSGIHSLKIPAYNANLLANGRPDCVARASIWARCVALLA